MVALVSSWLRGSISDWRLSQPGFDPSFGNLACLATAKSCDTTKQSVFGWLYIYTLRISGKVDKSGTSKRFSSYISCFIQKIRAQTLEADKGKMRERGGLMWWWQGLLVLTITVWVYGGAWWSHMYQVSSEICFQGSWLFKMKKKRERKGWYEGVSSKMLTIMECVSGREKKKKEKEKEKKSSIVWQLLKNCKIIFKIFYHFFYLNNVFM